MTASKPKPRSITILADWLKTAIDERNFMDETERADGNKCLHDAQTETLDRAIDGLELTIRNTRAQTAREALIQLQIVSIDLRTLAEPGEKVNVETLCEACETAMHSAITVLAGDIGQDAIIRYYHNPGLAPFGNQL